MDMDIDNHKLMYHPDRVSGWQLTGDCLPIYVEIGPTDTCNHKCKFCALDFLKRERKYIDTKVMIDNIKDMSPYVRSIMFSGEGEPSMHKNLEDMIATAYENGIDSAITTNGVLLDKGRLKNILPYLSWLRFSIDAGTPQTYSHIHGTKVRDFETMLQNLRDAVDIKRQKNLRVSLGTQFLVTPYSIDEARKLAETLSDIGVDNLQIKPYSHHPQSRHDFVIDTDAYNSLEPLLKKYETPDFEIIFRRATMERILSEKPYDTCHALPFYALIDAQGNVLPCNLFHGKTPYYYGNINEQSFSSIWKGEKRKQVLSTLKQNGIAFCRKGCRLDAINRYLHRIKHPMEHDNFI